MWDYPFLCRPELTAALVRAFESEEPGRARDAIIRALVVIDRYVVDVRARSRQATMAAVVLAPRQ